MKKILAPASIVLVLALFVLSGVARAAAMEVTTTEVTAETNPGFTISTLDTNAGLSTTSIITGVDGMAYIAYYSPTSQGTLGANAADVKLAHCHNIACTSAKTVIVDSASPYDQSASIAIGSDGMPLIAYLGSDGNLKVAHCHHPDCDSRVISQVDTVPGSRSGTWPSIIVGTDGFALIAYGHNFSTTLRIAHCPNLDCTGASVTVVKTGGYFPKSITIGADGLGVVAYMDAAAFDVHLSVAHCTDVRCSAATVRLLDDNKDFGWVPSITIGTDGRPLIAYVGTDNRQLRVAHCINLDCGGTGDTVTAVDTTIGDLAYPGITIGPDGLGLVSYRDGGPLKVAHCENILCNRASTAQLDIDGSGTSITVGSDGKPIISYLSGNSLKVAHLSNSLGLAYVRPR